MSNTLEMINVVVAKGNIGEKQELVRKNAQYLESFIHNDREEEYQAYISTLEKEEV